MDLSNKYDLLKLITYINQYSHIDLLLGSFPSESHVIEYCKSKSNRMVICINSKKAKKNKHDDYTKPNNCCLIIMDFNQILYWFQLLEILTGYVDNIIFDSSTIKFIDNYQLWCPKFNSPIYQMIKPGGRIYFESLHSGSCSVDIEYTKIKLTLGLLPLTNFGEVNYTFNVGDKLAQSSNHIEMMEQSKSFQDYLEKITQEALSINYKTYICNNDNKPYPINTNYPITTYMILEKRKEN